MTDDPQAPSAVPVVRRAILVTITPPPKKQVDRLAGCLAARWAEAQLDFRRIVARETGVPEESLQFAASEWVRKHRDGKTPMIDFPRIRTIDPDTVSFDARFCMAICTDEMSSKVWSRVGLPLGVDGAIEGLDSADIRKRVSFFRRLGVRTASWAFDFLSKTIREEFSELRVRREGELEVSVLATDDSAIAPLLARMSDSSASARELLSGDSAAEQVLRYLGDAALTGRGSANKLSKDSNVSWFSSPTTVELANGDLDTREVLFCVRPGEDSTQVVGVGFDGLAQRTLAQQSALRVSRWIANRV